MRITESQLRRIIRQEVKALREGANDAQIIRDTLAMAGHDASDADLYELSSDGRHIVGPVGKISVNSGEIEYEQQTGHGYSDYDRGSRSYGDYGGSSRRRR